MPIFKRVNHDFFKKWTPEMAYVLGFFAADGNMIRGKRGNHYISFYSCDRELIDEIRNLLCSDHKVAVKKTKDSQWKMCYRLQIGSKKIFDDLVRLGMIPNKSLSIQFPRIPSKCLHGFIRGYFDGDGHVWTGIIHKDRRNPDRTLRIGFTSGSRGFLDGLHAVLRRKLGIEGSLCRAGENAYQLRYSIRPALILQNFMYNNSTVYLERKKRIFDRYTAMRA